MGSGNKTRLVFTLGEYASGMIVVYPFVCVSVITLAATYWVYTCISKVWLKALCSMDMVSLPVYCVKGFARSVHYYYYGGSVS